MKLIIRSMLSANDFEEAAKVFLVPQELFDKVEPGQQLMWPIPANSQMEVWVISEGEEYRLSQTIENHNNQPGHAVVYVRPE